MWIPLSRQNYLQAWKQAGYRIEMGYLRLRSAQLALRRIAARVRQGGHDVPRADVVRSATTVGEKSVKAKTRTRNEGKPTTELCRRSRACLAPCGEGCSEDCAHVRHAALRVGKRQGRGEEAVRLKPENVAVRHRRCRSPGASCAACRPPSADRGRHATSPVARRKGI